MFSIDEQSNDRFREQKEFLQQKKARKISRAHCHDAIYFPPAIPCWPSHDASCGSCCDFKSTQLLMRSMDCL